MMTIIEFFAGKNVFLTGGSGFIGKVLIEKLLRSCPDIGNIYVLLREKKGKSLESRMESIKKMPIFDILKEQQPKALDKLIAVAGDVAEPNLGLSESDRKILVDNVHIIYHTAASVRFDDSLRKALIINVRGTREMAKLALELKNIVLFMHVSTTYCNTDQKVVEERLYPAHADWRDSIKLAEECSEEVLNCMATKYITPYANTYTFAKSLAEHVVNDMCKGKIPSVIIRPSVVVSTKEEPFPGWNDNFNGPIGLLVAGGKGLLRICYGNKDTVVDYIPVDYIVKGMIITTHYYALKRDVNNLPVLNASQCNINSVPVGELIRMGADLVQDSPFSKILWNPRFGITKCYYSYYIQVLLFHMLPAFFLDLVLRIVGMKPMLFTLQRKIYIANTVLFFFMNNEWTFKNEKIIGLVNKVTDEKDREEFCMRIEKLSRKEIFEYFKNGKIGTAKYLLKEEFDREKGKKLLKRLWYLDMAVRTIFFSILYWFLIYKVDVLNTLSTKVQNYYNSLD